MLICVKYNYAGLMNNFYKKRHLIEEVDYEKAYWGQTTDPDGVLRKKKKERQQYLDDIKQELNYLNALPAGKILDVGCGLGFFLSGLDDKFDKYGVEISKLASIDALHYGKVFNGTLEDAKFEENFFDVVILYHVIEHLDSPESVLTEIKRILKKDGILLIGTPNFGCICAKIFGDNFRMLHDKTHVSLFSHNSLKKFLIANNFIVEKSEFPFFQTRHFTLANLKRMFDTSKISPPFYGNVMTLYCRNSKP